MNSLLNFLTTLTGTSRGAMPPPLETCDYKIIIRKPKKRAEYGKSMKKSVCCPIVGCLPIDFDP
jgi:hypothetical protein